MSLVNQIDIDFKSALKNKEVEKLSTLRLLKSAIKNYEIEQKNEVGDDDVIKIIQREIKQRKDSIESFSTSGRQGLADKEEKEMEILQKYMPEQLPDDELEKIIETAISEIGATSLVDMGKVMGKVMPQIAGRADGNHVSSKVREVLSR